MNEYDLLAIVLKNPTQSTTIITLIMLFGVIQKANLIGRLLDYFSESKSIEQKKVSTIEITESNRIEQTLSIGDRLYEKLEKQLDKVSTDLSKTQEQYLTLSEKFSVVNNELIHYKTLVNTNSEAIEKLQELLQKQDKTIIEQQQMISDLKESNFKMQIKIAHLEDHNKLLEKDNLVLREKAEVVNTLQEYILDLKTKNNQVTDLLKQLLNIPSILSTAKKSNISLANQLEDLVKYNNIN